MLASDSDSGLDIPDLFELASALGIRCEKIKSLKGLKEAFDQTSELVSQSFLMFSLRKMRP